MFRGAQKRARAISLTALCFAGGCSSDKAAPSVTCGAGTTLAGQECLPSGATDAGTTGGEALHCGPGTVLLGQICEVDRDAAESVDAGGDTSANAPLDGGDAGFDAVAADSRGTGPDASDFDASGSSQDGGSVPDDPCPTGINISQILRNCSTTCAAQSSCSDIACQSASEVDLPSVDGPEYVRTPSQPGMNVNCSVCSTSTAYSFTIRADTYQVASYHLRVTVSPPWSLATGYSATNPLCYDSATATQCAIIAQGSSTAGGPYPWVYVVTNDPNAPARNIVIEQSVDGGDCP